MATYITEDGNVYYENVPEEKRELFPNLSEGASVIIKTITDTDPDITGADNTRYVCGVVDTISITPPETGIIDVIFESGDTPTVLTIPETVLFPAWFDASSLQSNTIYEFNILDGVYCTVTFWYPPDDEETDETDEAPAEEETTEEQEGEEPAEEVVAEETEDAVPAEEEVAEETEDEPLEEEQEDEVV